MYRSRTSDSLLPNTGAETNEGEGASRGSPASESVRSEGDAAHHGPHSSEDHRPGKRKMEEWGQIAPMQKNQPGKASAATIGQGSRVLAAAPRLRYPPFPRTCKLKDIRNWEKECNRIKKILEKDNIDCDIPTMSKPKDPFTTEAVQSSKDKEVVLRAARNIVMVSYIMDDGRREPQCSDIIIKQLSDGSGRHRAMVMTHSGVVCVSGRIRDPLSVTLPDKKTVLDAKLIYFNDHYDIALLDIYLGFTLELPSIGFHPYRGNIKWLEEPDFSGRDHYIFLSSDIPEGGNGGMVIDHDGGFRGMAVVHSSPDPAVISISIIEKCIGMYMRFNSVARPILGIDIRTIALLNVQLLEDIYGFGIKGGFLVYEVYNPVAQELGIKRDNVIISINGRDAVRLPELEDYFLSLGWDYLMDKSTRVKEFKLTVFYLKSRVQRDVTVPVRYYDKPERDEDFMWMGSYDLS
ncbi:hypothetical protein PVAP13_5KG695200 [Panicum virgatum]|uniref:PDZ domain-containing protein n=1 Tax=Panicum virgatum TaxID=38727 RepID=A0A8T0SZL4_PANVG|nr:hypothetical protein PVAP13_5KG695200 [Panicum virgatum]